MFFACLVRLILLQLAMRIYGDFVSETNKICLSIASQRSLISAWASVHQPQWIDNVQKFKMRACHAVAASKTDSNHAIAWLIDSSFVFRESHLMLSVSFFKLVFWLIESKWRDAMKLFSFISNRIEESVLLFDNCNGEAIKTNTKLDERQSRAQTGNQNEQTQIVFVAFFSLFLCWHAVSKFRRLFACLSFCWEDECVPFWCHD